MKVLKIIFILFLSFITNAIKAQNTQHEFGFITDNDLYASFSLDKYYTNGLEVFFNSVAKTTPASFNKRIRAIKIGQKMYNPFHYNIESVNFQDRPYAGYVYLNYSELIANTKHLISFGVEYGFTGEKTKARETQNFVHKYYGKRFSNGWDTQIQEKKAFGIKASYVRTLYAKEESKVQVTFLNNTTLHSIFSNISSGLGFKINLESENRLNSLDNSSFYQTSIQNKNQSWSKEIYIGLKSYMTYQFKDYTVTGELGNTNFLTQKEFNIKPWVWYNDIGVYWNLKKWNISYHRIFHTANLKHLNTNLIRYGSIYLTYKF